MLKLPGVSTRQPWKLAILDRATNRDRIRHIHLDLGDRLDVTKALGNLLPGFPHCQSGLFFDPELDVVQDKKVTEIWRCGERPHFPRQEEVMFVSADKPTLKD